MGFYLFVVPLGEGINSWPIVSYAWFMLRGDSSQCHLEESRALTNFIYWTQTSHDAEMIADRYVQVLFFIQNLLLNVCQTNNKNEGTT